MKTTSSYEITLVNLSPRQWRAFLIEHSHLPGSQPNLELAQAFAHIGTLMDFKKYVDLSSDEAPADSPQEFLVLCGLLGLGNYLGKYHDGGLLRIVQEKANDSRPRVREAVVRALKAIGRKNVGRLLKYAQKWMKGSFYEQRAVVAALCEPEFLKYKEPAVTILELLDWVTATLIQHDDESDEAGYQALQHTLESCWSTVVADYPVKGKPVMERWMKEKHPIVDRVMRAALQKEPLLAAQPEWCKRWNEELLG